MNTSQYAFADRAHEQQRLASQAELFDPLTERVFRTAGIGNGMRVLDLGSGAGDVAMLAARLVGREGEVVGVERDPQAVASATARVSQAGLSNVPFAWAWANVMRGVLPLMERFGVATAAELEPDTLAERLQDELRATNGIVISPPMIGAWARLPG